MGEGKPLSDAEKTLIRKQHWAIDKVTRDLEQNIQINTAIAAVMELVNTLYLYPCLGDVTSLGAVRTVIQLLCPMAPHLMEELWQELGDNGLVSESSWPKADAQWLASDQVEIVVQINGKLRSRFSLPKGSSKEVLEKAALNDPKAQTFLKKKSLVKIIVIPDKLVNIVVQ